MANIPAAFSSSVCKLLFGCKRWNPPALTFAKVYHESLSVVFGIFISVVYNPFKCVSTGDSK